MLLQQTINGLNELRLKSMVLTLEEQQNSATLQELGFEKRLGLLVESELHARENNRLKRLLKLAKLKTNACPEDIDYRASRGLDRTIVDNLLTCDWIDKSLNTIITGPTGVGKTWLACALGQQAARKGHSVYYVRLARLLEDLEIAYGDSSLIKARAKLAKVNLLILDDWGLSPLTQRGRHELLELVDDRIRKGSILITSQLPIDQWHEYLGDPTIADAILDRLVHSAHRIELHGESLRKTYAKSEIKSSLE